MGTLLATLSQMAVLFSFIFIGWLLAKVGVVQSSASGVLAKLENNLFIPALVLGTFMNNFSVADIGPAWKLFVISCVITVFMAFVAVFISRAVTRDKYIQSVFTYGLAFANFGFMGNAVVKEVFPEFFDLYLIFTLPLWMLIYLWGVPYLLTPAEDGKRTLKSSLKSFINPMFISMLVGMVLGLTAVKIPSWINQVVTVSGDCMSPVAMLLTGITLSTVDFKKILRQVNIYVVSFIRLIIIPAAALGIIYFIPTIPKEFAVCIICSLAMPLGLNTVVIPSAYGKDTSVAAGMTVISHILSCATIPLVFYVMTLMLKF